jgi:4-hydroxy-tetrahydrodipicolinate synthase
VNGRELSVWLPTLHPFTKEGALDEHALRLHFRRLAAAGIGVFCANEGTGEAYSLEWDEIKQVLRIANEELKGRVHVRGMGRMVRKAAAMVDFVREVEAAGLDGVHIYALDLGHGSIPTEREQEAYLTDVLSECRLPTMVSVHNAAGYLYPIPLIKRLADRFSNFTDLILVTNPAYMNEMFVAVGDRLKIHVAAGDLLSSLALGGTGYAAPEGNLIPNTCMRFASLYQAQRYAEALAVYRTIVNIGVHLRRFGSIAARKAALTLLGYPMGYPREPRMPFPEEQLPELKALLDKLRIQELESVTPIAT